MIWLAVHQNANWSIKEGSLTEHSRGMRWWMFLINVRTQQAVSFDSLAAPWITPSPCSIPITPPALAALLNKTDAPMNPTRSLLYTVNYLQHLLTQYSFGISRWWQRSKQWQSHRPLHTWAASALLQWMGRVLPVLTQQPCSDVVYRDRNSLQKHDITLARVFSPVFYFWFSSLVWKPGLSGRKMCPKSASVQSHLGRKQAIQQAENSRGEEVRAREAEDASPGNPAEALLCSQPQPEGKL